MAFHDFGYLAELLHHSLVHGAPFQRDAHIGTCVVAQAHRIHVVARPDNHSHIDEALHALVDSGSAHATFLRHILEWDSGIAGNDF